MTTVVELEKVSRIVPKRFRAEDFRKMTEVGILPEESGWEIIDGYLIDKISIGSKHAGTVKKLNRKLSLIVADKAIISIQDPIHIDEYNEPEPDIALLDPRRDFYAESHPTPKEVLLLIKVSDSTIEYDRDIKKTLYAEAGIAEFWLVNLKENTVEGYSSPKNGNYRLAEILESGETIKAGTIENLELKIEEILGL
ncbi:MAG: Uma2 family endonuclease [Acidobacteria bacterium]|jgi:Uma2 family endonuclease|nr:Uma2 family endonuclease [Acidobacteriota bacterium]